MSRLHVGGKVEGRTRKIPNMYTVTGHPMDNTYQAVGMRTTAKDAMYNGCDALHVDNGFWQRGGGGNGLAKGNLCHRTPKNVGREYEYHMLHKHYDAARIMSLKMDRYTEDCQAYAFLVDALDSHLIAIMSAGQREMISQLITKENARGADHILRRWAVLFRKTPTKKAVAVA